MRSRFFVFSLVVVLGVLATWFFLVDHWDDPIAETKPSVAEETQALEDVGEQADAEWKRHAADSDFPKRVRLSVAERQRVFNQLLNRLGERRSVEEEPALLDAARYGFREVSGRIGRGEFRAQNLAHGFELEARASGISVRKGSSYPGDMTGEGELQLEIELTAIRHGDAVAVLSREPFREAEGRLARSHGLGVVEWWENEPGGLEHGYVVERALGSVEEGEELRFDLAMRSPYEATLEGEEIVFRDEAGGRAMTYDKLVVSDAEGRLLPAKLELGIAPAEGLERDSLAVSLVVDARGAAYPIVVDPTISSQLLIDLSGRFLMPDKGAAVLGNSILFPAFSDGAGFELWVSDGTEAGTKLVKDINPGRAGSFPREFFAAGPRVYFLAWSEGFGEELWCSDGTGDGTRMLLDANVGVGSGFYYEFVGFEGRLYFGARVEDGDFFDDGELWSSDGTLEGTEQLAELYPGEYGGRPYGFTESGGLLFFAAYTFDDETGAGAPLWVIERNGNEVAVRKLGKHSELGVVESITRFGDGVIFSGDMLAGGEDKGQELWKSDGTTEGTVLIKDIYSGIDGSFPSDFTLFQGRLVFAADDGFEHGRELWATDGTAEGTVMVKDIAVGEKADGRPEGSAPSFLTATSDYVYFAASDGASGSGKGQELWRTNGTAEGTELTEDIVPGVANSYPFELTLVGDRLFFVAGDPDRSVGRGRELWVSSGDGVSLVKDIMPGGKSSNPMLLAELGGDLYYMAQQYGEGLDASWEVWRSDGSSSGTAPLSATIPELAGATYNGKAYARGYGDSYVFFGVPGSGPSLWLFSEEESAFAKVSDVLLQNEVVPPPQLLVRLGDEILFSAFREGIGTELWKTDGTPTGTELVKDIYPGPESGGAYYGVAFGDFAYFQAETFDGTSGIGRELWKTDGTEAGTVLVKDINVGSDSSEPRELLVFGDAVYFSAESEGIGRELWKTDGSAEGTVLVKDLNLGAGGSEFRYFAVLADKLYFTAAGFDGAVSTGTELWNTDGTSAGTVLVRDIYQGEGDSTPRHLTVVGDTLFFSATGFDGVETTGVELWKSDGTEAGTVLVKDISLGDLDSYPENLTAMGETLFFSAAVFDGTRNRGVELWKSDGTTDGTMVVRDILPGGFYTHPGRFRVSNGVLYFNARGYEGNVPNGTELWRSDGTSEGTFIVRDIHPGVWSSDPYPLAVVNGELYFSADSSAGGALFGRELWKTDGTAEGTVLVEDLYYGEGGSAPSFLGLIGDYLYFVANNGQHGDQIRVLDTGSRKELPAYWIESIRIEGKELVVRVPSTTGWNFQLQRESSARGGAWIDIGIDQRGKGAELEFRVPDPAAEGTEFYRMVAFPSPVELESLGE